MQFPATMPHPARPLPMIPQVVPSRSCLACEVCCRFPEAESFLRPYFTEDEIRRAVAGGVDASYFPRADGGQIRLVRHPAGEGFVCPAFDAERSRCRIYEERPLDCRLYPYALMWDGMDGNLVLGWDTKCPFPMAGEHIGRGADETAALLESDELTQLVSRHPRLIGRFQEDVSILRPLPRLTAALRQTAGALSLRPLTLQDRPRFEAALAATRSTMASPLAAFSFASHYLWRAKLNYAWTAIGRQLCLFARSADGIFLALPPLGSGSFLPAMDEAFRYMRICNHGGPATRMENVPAEYWPELEQRGYRRIAKEPDYVYRADDVVELPGDRYKSQRAACNRIEREYRAVCEPYRPSHREACRTLFQVWRSQKESTAASEWETLLLEDAASAHEVALSEGPAAGLHGAVVTIDGRVRGYTFGVWLSSTVFCVMLEVADRRFPGLAQFMFRECCRAARLRGAETINTMDDASLPRLAHSKRLYHPTAMLANFIVTES